MSHILAPQVLSPVKVDDASVQATSLNSFPRYIYIPATEFVDGLPSAVPIDGPGDFVTVLVSEAFGLAGFVRSLTREPGYNNVRGIQLLKGQTANMTDTFGASEVVLEQAAAHFTFRSAPVLFYDCSLEVLLEEREESVLSIRDGSLYPAPYGKYLSVAEEYGLSSTFRYTACSPGSAPASLKVSYAALNYRDIMISTGLLTKSALLGWSKLSDGFGLEFAARSELGNEAMIIGLARNAIATQLPQCDISLLWTMDHSKHSLEELATVPVAYSTVYYALFERYSMHAETSILIHSAAGGVGLAALHICTHRIKDHQKRLFATCHPKKKSPLLELFPDVLQAENVSSSRDTTFIEMVSLGTDRRGVDVVLNSLAGATFLEASMQCLHRGGHFLELGKRDLQRNTFLGLAHLQRELAFQVVDLDQALESTAPRELICKMVQDGLSSGEVQPLPYKTFAQDDIAAAFSYMKNVDRIGKVLLRMDSKTDEAHTCKYAVNTKGYAGSPVLVVGGTGALGVALSTFLVCSGCHYLILASNNELTELRKTSIEEKLQGHVNSNGVSVRVRFVCRADFDFTVSCSSIV